jgi:hypothetical protein
MLFFLLIYDRRSVGQSVLMSRAHLGPATNFSFSLNFSSASFGFCYFVVPSLTRGRVNLLYNCFWALQSSHSWIEVPQNSRPYFTVSSEIPPNLERQVPVFISPGNRVAQLYPRALGSIFVASYHSQGYSWERGTMLLKESTGDWLGMGVQSSVWASSAYFWYWLVSCK